MIYGKLKIIDEIRDDKDKVLCQCDCGNQKRILIYNVKNGNTSSCGCLKKQQMAIKAKERFTGKKPHNFKDYTGKRIGLITVLHRTQDCHKWVTTYRCKCDCGTEFNQEISILRKCKYKICICGYKKHPLKRILQGMINRCTEPNDRSYRWYGGKGIKVCEDWMKFPIHFIQWAIENGWQDIKSSKRKERLSIDRIDSNKDYCPENCHWITLSANSKKAMNERWHG